MALPGLTDNASFITRTAETARNICLQCSVGLPSELIRRIYLKMPQEQKEDKADFRLPQCTSRYIGPAVLDILWSLHLPTKPLPPPHTLHERLHPSPVPTLCQVSIPSQCENSIKVIVAENWEAKKLYCCWCMTPRVWISKHGNAFP